MEPGNFIECGNFKGVGKTRRVHDAFSSEQEPLFPHAIGFGMARQGKTTAVKSQQLTAAADRNKKNRHCRHVKMRPFVFLSF